MLSFVIPVARKKVNDNIRPQHTLQVDTSNLTQVTTHSSPFIAYCAHITMSLKILCLITVVTFALIHCEQLTRNVSSNASSHETLALHLHVSDPLPLDTAFTRLNESESLSASPTVKYLPINRHYTSEWWNGPKFTPIHQRQQQQSMRRKMKNGTNKSTSASRSLSAPPKFEKRQDYYHDTRTGYEPLEGIFSSHGSMLDRNSDFYYILPILLVIGLGSFLIPIISTFFTAMITSGGLAGGCCRRRIRLMEKNQHLFPDKITSLWDSLEKSLSKYSKTFASLADLNDFKNNWSLVTHVSLSISIRRLFTSSLFIFKDFPTMSTDAPQHSHRLRPFITFLRYPLRCFLVFAIIE